MNKTVTFWVLWNLYLAFIPVLLAYVVRWLAYRRSSALSKVLFITPTTVAWLAFLPNTCYLLTEWRHFMNAVDSSNLFIASHFDRMQFLKFLGLTFAYLLYSGIGMIAFAAAIRPLARLVKVSHSLRLLLQALFFTMLALGVYLGLVLRFNSWDILMRPMLVWNSIAELIDRPMLSLVIIAFGLILWLSYVIIDIWFDGLRVRLGGRQSAAT